MTKGGALPKGSELEKAIATAKAEDEKLVDSSVADATKKANTETTTLRISKFAIRADKQCVVHVV